MAQENPQRIQTSATLDFLAPFDFEDSAENKLEIRSAELIFFGTLDSTFDALLNFAAHNEDGEYTPEIHEAYVGSNKIVYASSFKLGKFFLGVGRLNSVHQSDWVFISSPRVQTDFFSEEGVADTGIEFSFPLPVAAYWDLTLGVTNGYNFGESTEPDSRPHVPTHYIRPSGYVEHGEVGQLQWGLNYLGRTDAASLQTQLFGVDLTYTKGANTSPVFFLQSELWYRIQNSPTTARSEQIGAYVFPQMSLAENVLLGVRVDIFKDLKLASDTGDLSQDNLNYAFVPTFTYKHSPSATLRTAYTLDTQTTEGQDATVRQKIEFQWIATLGTHSH